MREGPRVFGIGLPELLLIVVVVLIFINPKDMPSFFKKAGKIVREMRRMREGFLKSLEDPDGMDGESEPRGGGERGRPRTGG